MFQISQYQWGSRLACFKCLFNKMYYLRQDHTICSRIFIIIYFSEVLNLLSKLHEQFARYLYSYLYFAWYFSPLLNVAINFSSLNKIAPLLRPSKFLKYSSLLSQKTQAGWKLDLLNNDRVAMFLVLFGVLDTCDGFFFSRSKW